MMNQPGTRVVAVLSADDKRVRLLGRGIYEGDFPRPEWVASGERDSYAKILAEKTDPPLSEDEREAVLHQLSLNPRLRLDDGRVVWGFQCWWSPEEGFERWCQGREVVAVSDDRAELIAECDHPQLEYIGDPDPLTDLHCVKCPWQDSIDAPR